MRIPKRHQGLKFRRTETNPGERLMAKEWFKLLESGRVDKSKPDLLDHLLVAGFTDPRNPVPYCSQRDRLVANTVIQWLGSPVGAEFLRSVQERASSIVEGGSDED